MNGHGTLLKSCLGSLTRYSTHQETVWETGTSDLPSDSRLDLPGEQSLFQLDFNKWWGGGCKM